MVGRTLGHYRVLAQLGQGGMGIVYRAHDVQLKRDVAIKTLPAEIAADPERRRRFVQEAQAAGSLNHPNIAAIHEIGDADGVSFIVMELVDGRKLSDVLLDGPMPLPRAIAVASEIAAGLAGAHNRGVVHRDLNPANVMVTHDGHAKIIDFGLAKLLEGQAQDSSATTVGGVTSSGLIVGTVAYMSPEQARSEPVDLRSDIFSFGVTLFEMVTGQTPFRGVSPLETLHAIVSATPPPVRVRSSDGAVLAPELQRIVHRCLEKDPAHRYQTAHDLGSELRRLQRNSDAREIISAPRFRGRLVGLSLAATSVLVTTLAVLAWLRGGATPVAAVRLVNPTQLTFEQGAEMFPSWAPDGKRVAFMRGDDIWVTQLGASPINLTADFPGPDTFPSWSPDGAQITFASAREGGGYFVVSALGGRPRKVLPVGGRRGRPAWSADGRQLAGPSVRRDGEVVLDIITLQTMQSAAVPLPGRETWRPDLIWSPDGTLVAYVDAVFGNPDISELWTMRLSDRTATRLTDGRTLVRTPSFSPDSRSLYYVSNQGGASDLWVQTLRSDGLALGSPVRLTNGVGMSSAALSNDGTRVAYSRGRGEVGNVWRVPIVPGRAATWAEAEQLTADEALVEFIDVSPDGTELFFSSDRRGNQDIWRMGSAGGEPQQLTVDPTPDWRPSVSPDGKHIAFFSYRGGGRHLWRMPVAGGPALQLTSGDRGGDYHPVWSPDGSRIAFASSRLGLFTLWTIGASGSEQTPLSTTPADNVPSWSPDGEWIAFRRSTSDGNGIFRIPASGGAATPVAMRPGASLARWSPKGRLLYFTQRTSLWAVDVSTRAERQVADLSGRAGEVGEFSLATDGRFLYFAWIAPQADLWVMEVVTDR